MKVLFPTRKGGRQRLLRQNSNHSIEGGGGERRYNRTVQQSDCLLTFPATTCAEPKGNMFTEWQKQRLDTSLTTTDVTALQG